jgi:hypothetical protein
MAKHKALKYLFLLPMVVMLIFCMVFYNLIESANEALLNEKRLEKKIDLDLICGEIDGFIELDQDWESEYDYYLDSVAISMALLDDVEMTFAAAYDSDLNTLSNRNPSMPDSPFEPTAYPEFVEAVRANESGSIILWYEAPDVIGRDMYVNYRWVPTDATLPRRFLTVVAISSFSVAHNIFDRIDYGIAVLIGTTTILNTALVAFLCNLGPAYLEQKKHPHEAQKEEEPHDE